MALKVIFTESPLPTTPAATRDVQAGVGTAGPEGLAGREAAGVSRAGAGGAERPLAGSSGAPFENIFLKRLSMTGTEVSR